MGQKFQAALPANTADNRSVVYKAFFRAATFLALRTPTLEDITGLSQPTLSRLKQNMQREIHPKSFENILLLLRIFRSLDAIFGGNVAQSKIWLNADNHALGACPLKLIVKTEGLVRVVTYLDAMRAKV